MKKRQKKQKSFTLVEVIVVVSVMGFIVGGLLVAMSHILNGEVMLKKMQAMEEESRFIMDLFAQDAQYSELASALKLDDLDSITSNWISFILTEKRSDVLSGSSSNVRYDPVEADDPAGGPDKVYFIKRTIWNDALNFSETTTLNTTPLNTSPAYKVKKVTSEETDSYLISVSLTFKAQTKNDVSLIPISTSVVSRIFEF